VDVEADGFVADEVRDRVDGLTSVDADLQHITVVALAVPLAHADGDQRRVVGRGVGVGAGGSIGRR